MQNYGNCSKNYINCRKHPQREGTLAARVNTDFRDYRKKVAALSKEAHERYEEVQQDETSRKSTVDRLRRAAKSAELNTLAVASDSAYKRWVDSKESEVEDLSKRRKSFKTPLAELNHVTQQRQAILDDIRANVEKEIILNRAQPLEGFRKDVAKLLIRDGEAFTDDHSFGDSRGSRDYEANQHFDDCEPALVRNYEEDYTWNVYDSFTEDQQHGISARISCKCGEVYNTHFVMENYGFNSMLERLMNVNDDEEIV
jgi:hypothetical protein